LSSDALKLVIGAGDFLDLACEAWRAATPEVAIERVEVAQDNAYRFDMAFLDGHDPARATVFAAFDDRFLNFKRLELLGICRLRGFRLPPCIAPGAVVAPGVKLGENAFVGHGAVLSPLCRVDYNAVVGAGCSVGFETRIGHSAWLEAGAVIADRAEIGAQTSVTSGVVVARGVRVGKLCELRVPGLYREDIADKTYYNPNYPEPLRIFN
jgi:hypothetical protein